MKKIPNFFIVGYPKTGTTSLYEYLSRHPDVFACPVKEPGGDMEMVGDLKNFGENLDWYLGLFKDADRQKIVFESNPRYIFHPEAAAVIRRFNPEAKILILVREPVTYTISLAFQRSKNMRMWHDVRRDIRAGAEYARIRYADQVGRFLDVFGKDRVEVILYDDYERDNAGTLLRITEFLAIAPLPLADERIEKNSSSVIRSSRVFRVKCAMDRAIIHSESGATFRRRFKSFFGNSLYQSTKTAVLNFFDFFSDRRPEAEDLFEERELAQIKNGLSAEVSALSTLLDRDLNSLWDYPRSVQRRVAE